jgi:protein-S-isoprenylcysteine O-methyltransferase Ste14
MGVYAASSVWRMKSAHLLRAMQPQASSTQSCAGWTARTPGLIYGTVVYTIFLGTFLYAIGFIGRFIVPKAVNSGGTVPPLYAVVIDLVLLGLCAIQHGGKARRALTRAVRHNLPPVIARSTHVLCSCLVVIALFVFWQPVRMVLWQVDNLAIAFVVQLLSMIGWLMVLYGTFLAGHFQLFGLKQVAMTFTGRAVAEAGSRAAGIDRVIRRQICLGFIIAFWATPKMTAGQLLFAAASTAFLLVGIAREKRRPLRLVPRMLPAV